MVTLLERLMRHTVVRPSGCWYWVGSISYNGYGRIRFIENGRWKHKKATHVAWLLAHGSLPRKGLMVCHACDVPCCVRPAHLFVGTAVDNRQDAIRKGRVAGLSVEQIEFVWANRKKMSQSALAKKVGIVQSSISSLLSKLRKKR